MRRAVPFAILMSLLAACGGRDEAPVPRRRAYPRIAVADSAYVRVAGAAMPFEANTAAEARTDSGGRWLTLHYPVYNADVYVTFSEVDGAEALIAVLDNRRERMSLSLNGAHASTIHVTSADGTFETALVEAPGSGTTLQFVSTDGGRRVVSGAVRLDVPASAPYDSLQPVVAALRRDLIHAFTNLSSDD